MKILLCTLCLLLLAGLCACGAAVPPPDSPEESLPPQESLLPQPIQTEDTLYENLMAWAESEEEARKIAEAYDIQFCDYILNIATFHTDEDPREVVRRGKEQGLPELSVNGTMKPFSAP